MNWDALGAIGEIVGAIAVVLSLLYLAVQVKLVRETTDRNTRQMRNTGIRELSPVDIGNAVIFAVQAPAHVNISTIEVQPLEQAYGGLNTDPVARISG